MAPDNSNSSSTAQSAAPTATTAVATASTAGIGGSTTATTTPVNPTATEGSSSVSSTKKSTATSETTTATADVTAVETSKQAASDDKKQQQQQQQQSSSAATDDLAAPANTGVESTSTPIESKSDSVSGDQTASTAKPEATAQDAAPKKPADAADAPTATLILDKNRNRSELMNELRKLRSQVADVRRRALASQASLTATRKFVEACSDKLSTEQLAEWNEIEKSINLKIKANEDAGMSSYDDLGNGAAANNRAQQNDSAGKRSRNPRGARRTVTKPKSPKMMQDNGGQNMMAALARGIQQQAAMEQHDAANAIQQYRHAQHEYAHLVPGAPVPQKKGKRRRQPPHSDAAPKHADEIAKTEAIRSELRAAGNVEELSTAMNKAKKASMTHEVQIAQKKIASLKSVSQSSTEASAASSRVQTANSAAAEPTTAPATTAPTTTAPATTVTSAPTSTAPTTTAPTTTTPATVTPTTSAPKASAPPAVTSAA